MGMNTTNDSGRLETLMQAVTYFSDSNAAHDFFAKMRWPNGPGCPRCGSTDVSYSEKYRRFECKHRHERRQFTVKTGTVMEDSPLGLDKWAVAFWLEVNAKNSISSYEIHRALGITQKSAWFMLHRVRLAVKEPRSKKMGGTGGICEADETFVGGKVKNMHESRLQTADGQLIIPPKAAVMGLLERHAEKGKSKVRTAVVPNIRKGTLHDIIHKNVEPGTAIYTDALHSYKSLGDKFFHDFVDHAERYAKGAVHCNGMENFWTLFKRCIKGTHVSVDPAHLEAYLDSEAFRFNNRATNDGQRFRMALGGMSGKRLTYRELIGAMGQPPETTGTGQAEA
jgi:transposase-like protein